MRFVCGFNKYIQKKSCFCLGSEQGEAGEAEQLWEDIGVKKSQILVQIPHKYKYQSHLRGMKQTDESLQQRVHTRLGATRAGGLA